MTPHDIFIGAADPAAEVPAPAVREVIAAALGGAFRLSADAEPVPVLAAGPAQVLFHDHHEFEDDVDLPVSRYRYWVSVQDTGRDEDRQLAVARRIFDAARTAGMPALLSYGLQGSIAIAP